MKKLLTYTLALVFGAVLLLLTPGQAEAAKTRPKTVACTVLDWACRARNLELVNRGQEEDIERLRKQLRFMSVDRNRIEALEQLVASLPAQMQRDLEAAKDELKKQAGSDREAWNKRVGDFEITVNNRFSDLEARMATAEAHIVDHRGVLGNHKDNLVYLHEKAKAQDKAIDATRGHSAGINIGGELGFLAGVADASGFGLAGLSLYKGFGLFGIEGGVAGGFLGSEKHAFEVHFGPVFRPSETFNLGVFADYFSAAEGQTLKGYELMGIRLDGRYVVDQTYGSYAFLALRIGSADWSKDPPVTKVKSGTAGGASIGFAW